MSVLKRLLALCVLALSVFVHDAGAQGEPLRLGFYNARTGGQLANASTDTVKEIGLFWKYDPQQFIAASQHSRDVLPA